jgi:hypothetical protein
MVGIGIALCSPFETPATRAYPGTETERGPE